MWLSWRSQLKHAWLLYKKLLAALAIYTVDLIYYFSLTTDGIVCGHFFTTTGLVSSPGSGKTFYYCQFLRQRGLVIVEPMLLCNYYTHTQRKWFVSSMGFHIEKLPLVLSYKLGSVVLLSSSFRVTIKFSFNTCSVFTTLSKATSLYRAVLAQSEGAG